MEYHAEEMLRHRNLKNYSLNFDKSHTQISYLQEFEKNTNKF